MAKLSIVVDDLDGKTPEAATVAFALDGIAYEIDLADANAERLRTFLAEFIGHARKVGRVQMSAGVKVARPSAPVQRPVASNGHGASKPDNQTVRDWAKNKGIEVNDRGRVPAHVVSRFEQEAQTPQTTESADLAPQSAADESPSEPSPADAPKQTARKAGRQSTMPPAKEVIAVFNQTGHSLSATAEHFKKSLATTRLWIRKAQDELDPVS